MGDDRRIEELKRAARRNPDAPHLKTELIRALLRADRLAEARKAIVAELRRDRLRHDLRALAWDQARLLLDDGPWPMAHGDAYNRNLSPRHGARLGRIALRLRVGASAAGWTGDRVLGSEYVQGITASSEDLVFLVTSRDRLVCYDSNDWHKRWEREWHSAHWEPTIALEGALYGHDARGFTILDPDEGQNLAALEPEPGASSPRCHHAVLPSPEGLIIVPRRHGIELFDPQSGARDRVMSLEKRRLRSPLVLVDDLLAVYGFPQRLSLFERSGRGDLRDEVRWPAERGFMPNAHLFYDPGRGRLILSQPATKPQGDEAITLFLKLEDGRLDRRPQVARGVEVLALDQGGRCLALIDDAELCWLDGKAKQEELGQARDRKAAAVDAAGVAYVIAGQQLRAIAPGGHELFNLDLPAAVSFGPVIGPGGTVLLGLADGILAIID